MFGHVYFGGVLDVVEQRPPVPGAISALFKQWDSNLREPYVVREDALLSSEVQDAISCV